MCTKRNSLSFPLLMLMALMLLPRPAHSSPASDRGKSLQTARATARAALGRLDPAGSIKVLWPPHRRIPTALLGLQIKGEGETPQAQARGFLMAHQDLFLSPGSTLQVQDIQRSRNRQVVRFQQHFGGLQVEGGVVAVQLDHQGTIRSVSSTIAHVERISTTPLLTPHAAVQGALSRISRDAPSPGKHSRARLVILAEGVPRLIFKVTLPLSQDPRVRIHLVDARTGEYLGWRRGAITEGSHLHPRGGVR